MKKIILVLGLMGGVTTTFTSCGVLGGATLGESRESLAGRAVRDLLLNGVLKGITNLGNNQSQGGSQLYRYLLPEDVVTVLDVLDNLGLGSLVGNLKTQINDAAKQSITAAQPIFTNAVRNMTFSDAIGLVNGGQNSITNFFRAKTTNDLTTAFTPIVAQRLDNTGANDAYATIANAVNAIPFTNKKISTNLNEFVARQITNAMFNEIAKEEQNIRQNVAARTTDALRQVFASGKF